MHTKVTLEQATALTARVRGQSCSEAATVSGAMVVWRRRTRTMANAAPPSTITAPPAISAIVPPEGPEEPELPVEPEPLATGVRAVAKFTLAWFPT